MRYVIIPHTAKLDGVTKQYWQVVDVDAGLNERNFPKRVVATCNDRVAAEGIIEAVRAERDNFEASNRAWQRTLDHTHGLLAEARKERDSLRKDYECEARERKALEKQRDEHMWPPVGHFATLGTVVYNENNVAESVTDILNRVLDYKKEIERLREVLKETQAERCGLEVQVGDLKREYANARQYSATQGPYSHVVMSLAEYNSLVKERDEALAKYAACVDTVSFINGEWVKTS